MADKEKNKEYKYYTLKIPINLRDLFRRYIKKYKSLGFNNVSQFAPEEPSFIDTKNIICPVCKFHNSFDNKFCAQCGRVLDINTLKDIQDTIKIGNKIMSKQELTAEILRLIQEKTQDEK